MSLEDALENWIEEPFTDEDLSPQEVDDLYKSDIVVEEKPPQEESPTIVYAPRGKFYVDKYLAPDINRDAFIRALHEEAVATDYELYQPLNNPRLVHLKRHHSIDFYTPEFGRVMAIFLRYYGKGTLFVVTGFRSHGEIGTQPHSVGIAIDLKVESEEQRIRVMNAAYMSGIPTIIPGGEINKGEGFVHLDLAEKAPYIYDEGYYEGPWTV